MAADRRNRLEQNERPGTARPGFVLVVSIAILALLAVVVIGLLSLSTIQVREASMSRYDLQAKANARLALMVAMGELQKQLGPDRRVSAPAALLDEDPNTNVLDGVRHPHWTAVWSTRYDENRSILERDDQNGGLRDLRVAERWDRLADAQSFLVSGNEGGREVKGFELVEPGSTLSSGSSVRLVGSGSLGRSSSTTAEGAVEVPAVAVESGPSGNGHYAFWVGDLGTRANIATANPYESRDPSGPVRDGRVFQVILSQESSPEAMDTALGGSGPELDEEVKARLVSTSQLDLLGTTVSDWRKDHFHNLTVHSQGVLADTRKGGLKKDLTAYFQSNGQIEESAPGKGDGIRDNDRLVGPRSIEAAMAENFRWADSRHRSTSPRFGLLRRWAELAEGLATDDERSVKAIIPQSEPAPRIIDLPDMASSNLTPASIASLDRPNLVPILVEGSMYSTVSWHRNPEGSRYPYNVRLHTYPRVVLWNPYNVDLTLDHSMILLHVNGRKEMWTDGLLEVGDWSYQVRAQWIWFVGGRSNEFRRGEEHILNSKLYTDPYIGSFYYSIPSTTFGPGECLVFTPNQAAEYSHVNLEQNTLTPQYSPEPALNYYFTASELDGGIDFRPTNYWFAPTPYWNIKNQADDFRMILKHRGRQRGITPEAFDELPQIAMVSCALQYGAGREPRLAWNEQNKELMEETALINPTATRVPNVRTRDGYRLRWFEEHPSNLVNSGGLNGTPHFESAPLANWNPRAAYAVRSPWENIAGSLPTGQSGGGPWFFGIYTRDLFDQAVSWFDMMPVPRNRRLHGNPFGQPIEGTGSYVLYDIPRRETGVVSLAQLQHAKLSEFVWHPSYAIGQSLADPRVETTGTAPLMSASAKRDGGWDADAIGWAADAQRSKDRDEWARFGRALMQDYPLEDHLVYDLSYEVNHTLWDEFFLSTGTPAEKENLLVRGSALPNGRHVLAETTRSAANLEALTDFHRAAQHLVVDGAFNVNSTSVDAWRALLVSTRDRGFGTPGTTPFPRVLDPPAGEWLGENATSYGAWSGFRSLNDDEIDALAKAIVREVKLRGPFLSLSDFVNRRLTDDGTGRMGPLQAAIEAAALNVDFDRSYPLRNESPLPDYSHPDNIADATRLDQTLKPASKAWGAPGYLTQADVLQTLGPTLTARSDTFVIRAYGDAVDRDGDVKARAWCEAVVQRTPEPVRADDSGLDSVDAETGIDFGRRFVLKSFRWLNPDEV